MEDQAFYSLRNSLGRLKRERDEITTELLKDKQSLVQIEGFLRKIKAELDFRVNELRDKENNLNDYDKVIKDSESTLQRLVETSNKLAQALDSESCFLREKIAKNK